MTSPNKEPFISVIIASFNSTPYLPKLFETLHEQTWRDFEVVLVNDGGTDHTEEMVEELKREYPDLDIRYVYTPNGGVAHARNVGLENARGTYVFCVDADDYLLPGSLEALAQEAKRTNADRVLAEKLTCTENGKVLANQELPDNPSTWTFNAEHGTLMRRAVFEENGLRWNESYFTEDIYMTFLFSKYCSKVAWVREPTYCWVMHPTSLSSPHNRKNIGEDIGVNRIREILGYSLPILRSLDEDSRAVMEYELVKLYAYELFRDYRYATLGITLSGYKKMKEEFQAALPEYRRNRYIYAGKKAPLRKYTRQVVACLITAEKLHVVWLLLTLYHIVSKFHTFEV